MGKDYYNILGVAKGASTNEIKKAFRKKAHEYHPDKAHGDEVKFKEVNEAYQVLNDEQKRQQYDQFGTTFEGAGAQYSHMNWSDFVGNFGDIFKGFSSASGGQGYGGFGDIFGDIFGGDRARSSQTDTRRRGRDLEVGIDLDLKEAAFGIEKYIKLESASACEHCEASGAEPGTKIDKCPECGGSGQVETAHRTMLGSIVQRVVCPTCRGAGEKPEKFCKKCYGTGRRDGKRTIKIKIPAGIDNGQSIRLAGQGEAGERRASSGDLYVAVRVRPDERFTREGETLRMSQPLTFAQAALGDSVVLETLDGPVKLKIPAGTQPGQVIKLKGKGLPSLHGSGRGDLMVEAQVTVPTKLSRKQKEQIADLGL